MKPIQACILFVLAAVTPLHAQWQLTPAPQSQFNIKSVFPQTPRLAVGAIDYGTLIRGGVFLTSDTGTTWKKVLDSASIECVLQSNRTLVAGTTFSGLDVSTDSGKTWKVFHVTGAGQTHTSVAAIGGAILVSTNGGYPIKGGVLRSVNGGASWDTSATGLLGNSVVSLSVVGGSVYAGAYHYSTYSASGGIYRSTDQGANWTHIALTATVWVMTSNGLSLFAGTDAGIYRSTDNGVTWLQTNSGLTSLGVSGLATLGTTVVAGTKTGGVFQSTDNGSTWSQMNAGLTDPVILTLASDGSNLFAGTAHGMWKFASRTLSLARSTVGVGRTSIQAGDTTLVSLIIRDAGGNRLPMSGLTIGFGLGSGTSGGMFTPVVDSGNGAYTAVFTGTTPGMPTPVTATINGSAVSNTMPSLAVTARPVPPPRFLSAEPGLMQVTLHWQRPADPRSLRYRIYGGSSPGPVHVIDSVSAGNDTLLSWTISGLSSGTRYYVRVTASDSTGEESPFSNEVSAIPFGYGAVSGIVLCDSAGLGGVKVRLFDSTSTAVAEVLSDTVGRFFFPSLRGGTYGVMLVEPLGYADTLNPAFITVVPPDTVALQCQVFRVVTSFKGRTLAYWKFQLDAITIGKGTAQESLATLSKDIAVVSGPLAGVFPLFRSMNSVAAWDSLYRLTLLSSPHQWAMGELGALLLNLSSLKIAQYAVATQDGRTAADVAVYVYALLADADSANDLAAFALALQCDLHLMIKAGTVPAGGVLLRVGEQSERSIPNAFRLAGNYPNPFNPSTTIVYELPVRSRVSLRIYNTLGQCVSVLADGIVPPGSRRAEWRPLGASGVYLCRLEAVSVTDPSQQFHAVTKLLFLK